MARQYTCDRCGVVIPPEVPVFTVTLRNPPDGGPENFDHCGRCAYQVLSEMYQAVADAIGDPSIDRSVDLAHDTVASVMVDA